MKQTLMAFLFAFTLIGVADAPVVAADDSFRFRAVTYNIKELVPSDEVKSDLRRILKDNPDAIGFQEIGGEYRAGVMSSVLSEQGYKLVRLDGPAQATPVAFDNVEYDKVRSFAWHLSDETLVRVPGPGPRIIREKEATVVVLKGHGRTVAYVSSHLVPAPELNRERNELHQLQMRRLARLHNHLKGTVDEMVFVGDYNTGEVERLSALTELGYRHETFLRTHEHGSLDHVLTTMRPGYEYTIGGLHSDHKALVVNIKE